MEPQRRWYAYSSNVFHRTRFIRTEGFGSCELHQEQVILDKIVLEILNRQRSIANTLYEVMVHVGMPDGFHIVAVQEIFDEVSPDPFLSDLSEKASYQ